MIISPGSMHGKARSIYATMLEVIMIVCTAHMTPPAQPKKCAASSNGALISLSAALNRSYPIGELGSHRYKT